MPNQNNEYVDLSDEIFGYPRGEDYEPDYISKKVDPEDSNTAYYKNQERLIIDKLKDIDDEVIFSALSKMGYSIVKDEVEDPDGPPKEFDGCRVIIDFKKSKEDLGFAVNSYMECNDGSHLTYPDVLFAFKLVEQQILNNEME